MNKRTLQIIALAASLNSVAACSSSNSGGPADGGGTDGTSSSSHDSASGPGDSGFTAVDAGNPGETGSPVEAGADGGVATDGSIADSGALLDVAMEASCDVVASVPDFIQGAWLICDAVVTNGRIWTGTLTITSETPSCGGAALAGTFHWISTNMGSMEGDTLCRGSYVAATQKITLDEYQVTGGTVGTGSDYMTYDPGTDQLVNGGWTCGSGCPTGTWTAATRVSRDAGTSCAGDL